MKAAPSILRPFAETLAIAAAVGYAIMALLPVMAPGVTGTAQTLLGTAMLTFGAGPLMLWRMNAAMKRGARSASRDGGGSDVPAVNTPRPTVGASLAVLALGLGCSLLGAKALHTQEHAAETDRFGRLVERVNTEVARRLNTFAYGLRGARGMFIANERVERSAFREYVASRDLAHEFPGAYGFGYIQRVPRADLGVFETAERADGSPDFAVRTSGRLPDLYVVKFIEPLENNRPALGLDYAPDPDRRAALERAMLSGTPAITGRVTLSQDEGRRPACVCFLPVYRRGSNPATPEDRRRDLVGWVYTPVVLADAMADVADVANGRLDIEIFDGPEATRDTLLFDDDRVPHAVPDAPAESSEAARTFRQRDTITVCGREWTLWLGTTPAFDADANRQAPVLAGAGGGLISILLALIVWSMGSARTRAVALAAHMTAELRASEAQARAALAKLGALQRALDRHAIIAVTDASGTIIEANNAFCRISGYSREELIGAKHSILNSGHHPKAFWVQMWKTIAGPRAGGAMPAGPDPAASGSDDAPDVPAGSQPENSLPPTGSRATPGGGTWRAEVRNRAKDGSLYWVDTTIAPVLDGDGRLSGYISIRFDITDRKQAEHLLQYAHDNLEQRVSERTAQLAEAKEAAEAASRAKSAFLAHMSHEIRTPINGVSGMLDLLLGTPLSEQQRRFTDLARASTGNLMSVINDILDFSKIEAGKLDIAAEDFDLLTTVEDVVQMLAHRAQQKGVELTCALEPTLPRRVRGDADRLRQILTNLVGNAIKFTRQGAVVVRAVLEEQRTGGPLVRFTVSDTGIGIPPDRLERLFKPFSQADSSTTRQYGGTGLGLAISKRLAELMGGEIGVASDEGSGSTFWCTVALAPPSRESPAPDQPARGRLAGRRLLMVGGSAFQRDVLCEQFAGWGLRVDEAESGDEGLTRLSRGADAGDPFTLAIVDLHPGAMDPFEFAAAVRRDPRLNATALLLQHPMTAPIDPERLRSVGFAGDLAMPARQSHLLDALMNATAWSGIVPAAPAPAAPPPQPSLGGAQARRLRVLIAEDNEINQIVAREMLTRAGYDCDIVGNGRLAVEAVRREGERYDLVLMDCQMPEMDGFDATREIRRMEKQGELAPRPGRLPIVALTANAMRGDREKCLEAGMDAHTSKPINPKQLLQTIDRMIQAPASLPKAA